MKTTIKIQANGRSIEIPAGSTLLQLLERLEEPGHPDQVVEINCRYVDVRDYSRVVLQPQDRVEVLRVGCWGLRP